ncbi:hypothetical protein GCM10023084_62330 [Streptomyces lacrimifluminis]|uniref:Uncharacterized protein n=1 Tax=Streptomyces lacrimifluminis TaxID=1500077 RepID=A0A917NZL5_9ACTN|nr:hypothetical protein GCM10012282_47170 [Streptomyces lacrimifluminis]
MRTRLRRLIVMAAALLTATTALPAATAQSGPSPASQASQHHPSHGGLSAVIRYTEYGIPHIVAKDYTNLGFGSGWAQAADQVCVLADGFVTLRGDRSRWFGPGAETDFSLSDASDNLSNDLYFRGVRDNGTVERLLSRPAPQGPSKAVKDLMNGWAAGYNAWLRQNRVKDQACAGAAWVRPVTGLDVATRAYALAVLGGQGGLVDAITAAQPPAASTTAARSALPNAAAAAKGARELFDLSDMGSNAVAFNGSTTAKARPTATVSAPRA